MTHKQRMIEDMRRASLKYAKEFGELKEETQALVANGWNTALPHVGKIALVCIAKNEQDYIHEWIDYHLKLGVDEIFVYENDWDSGLDHESVIRIPWNGERQQIYAYNSFLYTHAVDYDWVIFLDVDEFLVLHKHASIRDFLKDYGNLPKDVDGIAVNWMMFGDNGAVSNGPVVDRFTRRGKLPDRHIKMIVRLNAPRLMMGPHHSYGFWMDTNKFVGHGQNNYDGPCDVIQINHYFCKTLHEFQEKMKRRRADWCVARSMEDFELYNQNEVEDYTARDFKWK